MTEKDIAEYGTRQFHAPAGHVRIAVLTALQAQGFAIAHDAENKIETEDAFVRQTVTVESGHSIGTAPVVYTRRYVVDVSCGQSGSCTVQARPSMHAGGTDISGQYIWDLDGPDGERSLWKRLFRDIDQLM